MRFASVEEEPDEDVFAKVVIVAEKASSIITANDESTCHRLTGRCVGPKSPIARFVRCATKHQLMKHERTLEETSIYVYDDFDPWRAKITRDLRNTDDARGVVIANDKHICIFAS